MRNSPPGGRNLQMTVDQTTEPAPTGAPRSTRAFWHDRRGVAAVEFALLVPVMLMLYFLTMEIGQAIETSKKVSRVGSMVADLVAQQQQNVAVSEVDSILQIGESLLQPYNRSLPTIIVTGVQITDDTPSKVLVAWSRKLSGGKYSAGPTKGTTTTVPDNLKVPGSFLIRVQSNLSYKPVISWDAQERQIVGDGASFGGVEMGDSYYLRPRMTDTMTCVGC